MFSLMISSLTGKLVIIFYITYNVWSNSVCFCDEIRKKNMSMNKTCCKWIERWRVSLYWDCDLVRDVTDLETEILLLSLSFFPEHIHCFISRNITLPSPIHLSHWQICRWDAREGSILKNRKYDNPLFLKHWIYKMIYHFILPIFSTCSLFF